VSCSSAHSGKCLVSFRKKKSLRRELYSVT
jgi:hypothetical protein